LGASYESILGADAMRQLVIYYQQRHILAHQQGIVDADYVTRSQDTQYSFDQRLIIREAAVLNFAGLIEKLGKEIMRQCALA